MPMIVYDYFLLFFFCSVLGWLMEVTCKLIQFRRFINRGFLIGPYCPIYGFGAVFVTWLLSDFSASPVAVFGLAVLICGTLEYLTSYLMEKLFHARWWDYSQKKFNLNGRVCADTLLPFGLLGLTMIYFVKPWFFGLLGRVPDATLHWISYGLLAILLSDVVVSTLVLSKIRKHTNLSEKDDTEAITKSVREALVNESALVRRILRAFPYAKLYNNQYLAKAKAKREQLRGELKAARQQMQKELNAREAALKAAIEEKKRK